MQKPHLPLKEILWEITSRCNNGCTYCGSSENGLRNKPINETEIRQIAKLIGDYPPENIDISGGDPLLVSLDTHKYIVDFLKTKNVNVKILINPLSFRTVSTNIQFTRLAILDLYNWCGVSVNTIEELEIFKTFLLDYKPRKQPITDIIPLNLTVISNFNISNIFYFDKIKEIVKQENLAWQIQFTMFRGNNDLAIYNNPEACKLLFEKMNAAISEGVKIIPADNLNCGKCGAGLSSLGILSNGDVVPCLSMRSWMDSNTFSNRLQSNIFDQPLADIWKYEFYSNRFSDFKCCKDVCNNLQFKYTPLLPNKAILFPPEKNVIRPNSYPPLSDRLVTLYGVDQGPFYVYGVTPYPYRAPTTAVYAVGQYDYTTSLAVDSNSVVVPDKTPSMQELNTAMQVYADAFLVDGVKENTPRSIDERDVVPKIKPPNFGEE